MAKHILVPVYVFFITGTYTYHNWQGIPCSRDENCQRGVQFYIQPKSMYAHVYTTITLEYEVKLFHSSKDSVLYSLHFAYVPDQNQFVGNLRAGI